MTRAIRIGTRRSRLAVWQAEWVAKGLRDHHPDLTVDLVPIRTEGDRDRSTALSGMGQIGVFTKEIETALLEDRCDVAVHSLKDLPTRLAAGLSLGAVLERADPRDAFIAREGGTLAALPKGSVLGTSSLRRRAQILNLRPDLVVRELRGNVPTRLRAAGVLLEEGDRPDVAVDATVLARAGLMRLGFASHASQVFSFEEMLPAPGQGAVGVEIRADDHEVAERLIPLDHGPTRLATAAEREVLEVFGGWCHLPAGALAVVEDGDLRLRGLVGDPDGRTIVRAEASGKDPRSLGREVAERLLKKGAREILDKVLGDRHEVPPFGDRREEPPFEDRRP